MKDAATIALGLASLIALMVLTHRLHWRLTLELERSLSWIINNSTRAAIWSARAFRRWRAS